MTFTFLMTHVVDTKSHLMQLDNAPYHCIEMTSNTALKKLPLPNFFMVATFKLISRK